MKVKKAMHFTLEVQIKLMDLESITTATLDEGINHMSDVVDINNSIKTTVIAIERAYELLKKAHYSDSLEELSKFIKKASVLIEEVQDEVYYSVDIAYEAC